MSNVKGMSKGKSPAFGLRDWRRRMVSLAEAGNPEDKLCWKVGGRRENAFLHLFIHPFLYWLPYGLTAFFGFQVQCCYLLCSSSSQWPLRALWGLFLCPFNMLLLLLLFSFSSQVNLQVFKGFWEDLDFCPLALFTLFSKIDNYLVSFNKLSFPWDSKTILALVSEKLKQFKWHNLGKTDSAPSKDNNKFP